MTNVRLALVSPIASGGVAHFLDTSTSYTAGNLFEWRNNGVAKASLDYAGVLTATGFAGALNGTVGAITPASVAATTLSASGIAALNGGVTQTGSVDSNLDGLTLRNTSAGTSAYIRMMMGTAAAPSTGRIIVYGSSHATLASQMWLGTGVSSPLVLMTNGVASVTILSGGASTFASTVAVTGVASFAAGAVATPSIARTGNLNTGLWFPALDTIAASTAGIERLRISDAGAVTIANLAGAGSRTVVADANGVLSAP